MKPATEQSEDISECDFKGIIAHGTATFCFSTNNFTNYYPNNVIGDRNKSLLISNNYYIVFNLFQGYFNGY